jgi:type VI secretion system secreted protein VgrG
MLKGFWMKDDNLEFSWEKASHPDGPWMQLRVVSVAGGEEISGRYEYVIDLVRRPDGADVDVEAMIGARATLRIRTRTQPAFRLVHGIVVEAGEIADAVREGTTPGHDRYRVILASPLERVNQLTKSLVFLDKTVREIVDATLQRQSLGAGLTPSTMAFAAAAADDGDATTYLPFKTTYAWRVVDVTRIMAKDARPYVVQYQEGDRDFFARLLEDEGIAYHWEHRHGELCLVLSDFDRGRAWLPDEQACAPGLPGREIFGWRAGRRLRPRSVLVDDFDWERPDLDLLAASPSGITELTTFEQPGGYRASRQAGEKLAEKREQRLDSERRWAAAETSCRALGAGSVVHIEHAGRAPGRYLVTTVEMAARDHDGFGATNAEEPTYRAHLVLLRCDDDGESHFRPARATPRPRIHGTQTAWVTADPTSPTDEIHLGGPSDIGCVRLRFHWDQDHARCAQEPSSCWVRVSQIFAGGRGHGALWHPRVGDEVIVAYLDGDPDRPIVVGRVYNGRNLAPENATNRPTWSAIQSMSSPYDGNYNLIGFEDQQGAEQIVIHAAKDFVTNVEKASSRNVGTNDDVTVDGNQKTHIKGNQDVTVDGTRDTRVGVKDSLSSPIIEIAADSLLVAKSGAVTQVTAGSMLLCAAPVIHVAGGLVIVDGNIINITAKAAVNVVAGVVNVNGGSINLNC